MRVVFLGDIVGQSGRQAVQRYLTPIFQTLRPDLVVANAENAAHGVGLTPRICEDLFSWGVDVITTGNHVFDKREIIPTLETDPRVLRPANYPASCPGQGLYVCKAKSGERLAVMNLMGRVFMDPLDDPFAYADRLLDGLEAESVLIDFHAEATSEKAALAYYLDGRVSALIGTHTHAPTADTRLLPQGLGFQSDAGMCGDYNSVIGVLPSAPIENFTRKMKSVRMEPAEGEGSVSGVAMRLEGRSCKAIAAIRLGAHLANTPLEDVAALLT